MSAENTSSDKPAEVKPETNVPESPQTPSWG
jgi:hypothetical protein